MPSMDTHDHNFIFFGTPTLAKDTLEILKTQGYLPKVIVTAPDRPSGRGMQLHQTDVATWAEAHGIECLKPEKITAEFLEQLNPGAYDLSIVVAYGKILPEKLITSPRYGTLNIHYSLLPKYRGASPLEQAFLQGDTETGVSIQQMAFKLDSGPILAEEVVLIHIDDTKDTLRSILTERGALLLAQLLPSVYTQKLSPRIQDEARASFCTKIKKEDGEIDPAGDAQTNYNKYRAYYGWPGVYFFIEKQGKKIRIKITQASYENNSFVIKRVIPEGKKEVSYSDFIKTIA